MADAHANFAYSTVSTAPSPSTSGTSLVVGGGDGALFPTPPFNATVWPANTRPLAANAEIVRVTGISTDTFTIVRAQESTSARTVVVGDQIAATITKKTLTDIEASSGVTELAYNTFTSNVNITSTTESPGDTVITASAITADGSTPITIEFYAAAVQAPNSAGAATVLSIFEGSTQIGRISAVTDNGTLETAPVFSRYRFTPSAGSHTYKITGVVGAGTGHVFAASGGAGAYLPGYIRIFTGG